MFSERLQLVIERLNWNQSRLAREIGSSSVQIGRWLQNKVNPTASSVRRIVAATGCNPDWLMTGAGSMFQEASPHFITKEEMAAHQREIYELQADEEFETDYYDEQDEWLEEKEREKEIAELLTRASTVLNFQFKHHTRCYSDSLAATINALYRAVRLEEKFIPKKGLMALLERAEKGQAKNK